METKICSKCGKELPIDQFYWKDKKAGRRRSECRNCHNNYVKIKYKERKDNLINLKGEQGCAKCGEKRGYLLDYHHLDPSQKEYTISRLTAGQCSAEKLEKELSKCIILCANCHREFHFFENNRENFTIEEYLASK